MSDDRQRLDFREVDAVEGKDCQHFAQRTLLMWEREDNTRLVGFGQRTKEVGPLRTAGYKKTCEIVLVVFYRVLKYLHPIEPGSLCRADGSPAVALVLRNVGSRTGCIGRLYSFDAGMTVEERAALHEGYGMGMDLDDCRPVVIGQAADAMPDVEPLLSHDRRTRLAQQVVVVQQAARYRVFDGKQGNHCRVVFHLFKTSSKVAQHIICTCSPEK